MVWLDRRSAGHFRCPAFHRQDLWQPTENNNNEKPSEMNERCDWYLETSSRLLVYYLFSRTDLFFIVAVSIVKGPTFECHRGVFEYFLFGATDWWSRLQCSSIRYRCVSFLVSALAFIEIKREGRIATDRRMSSHESFITCLHSL